MAREGRAGKGRLVSASDLRAGERITGASSGPRTLVPVVRLVRTVRMVRMVRTVRMVPVVWLGALALIFALSTAACGVKGQPRPPIRQPVATSTAAQ